MGIYEAGCGIENLMFAWGHDEYMYRMLVANGTTIPKEGLAMIRYHSAYPMHDKGEYQRFMGPGDEELLRWVKEFNKVRLVWLISRQVASKLIPCTSTQNSSTSTPRTRATRWTWRRSGPTTRGSSTSTCPRARSAGEPQQFSSQEASR